MWLCHATKWAEASQLIVHISVLLPLQVFVNGCFRELFWARGGETKREGGYLQNCYES